MCTTSHIIFLICISLMAHDIELLFLCFFAFCISSSMTCLFMYFAHFLIGLLACVFFTCWILRILYVCWMLVIWASLVAQMVKNLPAGQETWLRSPGWEDPLEGGRGNPLQCCCLENPLGLRSLAGYSLWRHKESDMTEWLSTTQHSHLSDMWFAKYFLPVFNLYYFLNDIF